MSQYLPLSFLSFPLMAESRVTVTRRKFVEILSEQPRITFTELKEKLVNTKTMNLATLYRIVDAFKTQ
jgi:Fe2+ or Zn2+ uptake regulation protein